VVVNPQPPEQEPTDAPVDQTPGGPTPADGHEPWSAPQAAEWAATGGIPVAPPLAGYDVPFYGQPGYDPLISADYGGWWQRSMAIVKAGWKQLATLQAIGLVVQMVVQVPLLVWVATQSNALSVQAREPDSAAAPDLGPILAAFGLSLLVTFAAVVVSAAIAVATMYVGVAIATRGSADVGPALGLALRRAFPLIGWQLIGGLLVLVGLCLCLLPAVYPIAVLTILPAVVAFERTNAVGRCFHLFHRSFGAAAGRIATILGITIAGAIIAGLVSEVVAVASGAPTGLGLEPRSTAVSMGTLVVSTAISAFVSVTITQAVAVLTGPMTLTAYADLRARAELLSTPTLVNEIGVA
jgi:hypothetical protein